MTDDQSWQAPGGASSGQGGSPDPDGRGQGAGVAGPPAGPAQVPAPGHGQPYPPAPAWGSAPAWTPPPKPGLLPLRPLGLGAILAGSFQALRRNPGPTVGSALLIQGLVGVVTLVLVGGVSGFVISRILSAREADQGPIIAGGVAAVVITTIVTLVLSIVASSFLQGVVASEVARGTLGERLRMRALWRLARPRLGPLVLWSLFLTAAWTLVLAVLAGVVALLVLAGGAGVAVGILVGVLGVMGLVVVAVWVSTRLALVPSAIVIERMRPFAAARRSWSLTVGSFWRVLGILLLTGAIVWVATNVVTVPLTLLTSILQTLLFPNGELDFQAFDASVLFYLATQLLTVVVSVVIGSVGGVVTSANAAIVYIDLRMRREGLDLELARFAEERAAGAPGATGPDARDPYRSPAGGPGRA
ncbi:glycerophosphoryl diester phosphodiesterase membrane domain-containing protein [Clavibacter capsici]|uniref:Glycerophosphoryl diester phosphodiesterase membrane domain-containing protein n=1 Tax=Clavibacter capsici TaxID=1874630 RepID=A0AAE7CBC3_9MICO|nr:glycerophosphoryl diester phosphodiesterase membrane domain-containing protein [Clavibacter capsici]ALD12338.1 hypothetical protein AES38_04795 [Clavibacter capsici]QIS44457.1 hypothetical protein GW570_04795 [Clavibacter capsici]